MKGRHLRSLAEHLLKASDAFTEDLQKNKRLLAGMNLLRESKKEFNKLAGEITTLVKQQLLQERERQARALTGAQPAATQVA